MIFLVEITAPCSFRKLPFRELKLMLPRNATPVTTVPVLSPMTDTTVKNQTLKN